MNDSLILNKLPDETAGLVALDTDRAPAITGIRSLGVRRQQKLPYGYTSFGQGTILPILKGASVLLTFFVLWLLASPVQSQTPGNINLSLHKKISNQAPALGDVLTYTVVVVNEAGSAVATGVTVTDLLPAGGVTYVPNSASVLRGNGTYTAAVSASAITGTWNIGSIAAGDSAVVTMRATVIGRGVWFNTAEVSSAGQTDANSSPGNQNLLEDDYSAVCFSVPIEWYPGDEFTVMIPSGSDQIIWYRDNTPISTSSVSTSLAEVNTDKSLIIKSVGRYRFEMYRNGCLVSNCCDIQLIPGPPCSLSLTAATTNAACGQNTGSINLTASGGTAPFSYVWSNGTTTSSLSGLTAGVYSVTVTDASGCSTTATATISNTNGPVVSLIPTNAGCGQANGSVAVTVTGGTPPISYVWVSTATSTTVSTSQNLSNVPAGTYSLTVRDASGCTSVTTVTVGGGTPPVVVATAQNAACGQSTGSVSLAVSGGLAPYTYRWSNSTTASSLSGLTAGVYSVTVTDASGCSTTATATINNTNGPAVTGVVTPAACGSTGGITLTVTGGTSPVTYRWSNGASTQNLTAVAAATYSVTVIDGNGCIAVQPFVIPQTSPITVTANDVTSCSGEVGTLTATASILTAQIRWYLTPTGGVAFATNSSGASLTVNPTATTIYYAEAFTADGCVSSRKPVTVTVTIVPTPVVISTLRNTCPATTANLSTIQIQNQTTGLVYEWYTSVSRSAATRVTNLTAVGSGNYYLFARSGNCYSNPTVVSVQIADCNCQYVAGVNVGPSLTVCSGGTVPLTAVLSGAATSVNWTSNGSGTFTNSNGLVATYTPSAADIVLGTLMLTATTNDPDGVGICVPANSSLILKINKRPDAPIGVACDDTLVCQGSSTKLVGFAPGGKINWYDQDNKLIGSTVSGGKLTVTPSRTGSVVYFAEAVSPEGCSSSTRSSVTIVVSTCLADLGVLKQVMTPGPYSVGQKITYSITATNKGPATATSVKVTDVLPATLTYVSSTPTGQYNPATGTWTIGTLITGSNRNLLVEATIKTAGSITNTASIGSPENDPRHPQDDTSRATIDVNQCVIQPPHIVCAITEICKGTSTTLTAEGCTGGTVKWSDGQTGLTVTVSPVNTTVYAASCTVGTCTSTSSNSITVTVLNPQIPVITASADKVCPGTSVTLTASGCVGGTIEWSEQTQTGTVIVVNPAGKTTYTAQCRVGSCLSTPATKTIDIASDLPTPTVTCSESIVCPGETVTLTVNNCVGVPVWSSTTATTGSIVVTPAIGNNSYTVYCKNGACTSKSSPVYTITVVAPSAPTVIASAESVCAKGPVSLTASGCIGTVVWNVAGKTGPVITVNPDATISYYAQCKYRTCLSGQSAPVTVTVLTPATPIISTSKTQLCSGDKVTLTATGCAGGTINWYPTNQTGASIDVYPTATGEYYATCKQGTCESESSNKIRITVTTGTAPAPTIIASATSVCAGSAISLTATGCAGGTVQWSDGQTGSVISVTPTANNTQYYALCKTTGQCGSGKSNVITINLTPGSGPAPTITTSTSTVCNGDKVTLTATSCLGTVQWYGVNRTGASIDINPTATQSYYAVCSQGTCSGSTSNTVTVAVNTGTTPPPIVTASTTSVCASGLVSLTATGCTGTVQWSDGQTGSVVSVSATSANNQFYAICKAVNQCGSGRSNVITINTSPTSGLAPTIVASTSAICSGDKVTLTATGCTGGTVQWYGISRTGASIDIYPTATQTYYAVCTLGACSSSASNTVTVAVNTGTSPSPIIVASTTAICTGGLVSLTATGCSGTVQWSDGQTGSVVSVSATPSNSEFYALCKTNSQCGSGKSNVIKINVTSTPTPIVTCSTTEICPGEEVVLTVHNCQGTPHWSSTTSTTTSITVTPSVTTSYTVYCQEGACKSAISAQYTITVVPVAAPTITASATAVTAGSTVTLTAAGCAGEVTWSANDINGTNKGASIVVRPEGTQTYYAQCKFRTCLSDPSATIIINPGSCVAKAGTLVSANSTVCASTSALVTISAAPNGGLIQPAGYSVLYILTKGADRVIQKTSTVPTFSVPSETGSYTIHTLVYNATPADKNYLDLTGVQPGTTKASDVLTLITNRKVCADLDATGATVSVSGITPPVLSAQSTITVCTGGTVSLTATGCANGLITWSDGSTGSVFQKTISSDLSITATCSVSGCVSMPSASVLIKVGTPAIPIIVSTNAAVCSGESVILTATGCIGGTYVWSDGTTVGTSLTLTPTQTVSYRVKCKIGNCEGDWSASTTITVGTPPTPTISATGSTTVCFGAPITLTAQGCPATSYVTWSNNMVGTSITVSPSSSDTYTARCSTSANCKSAPSNAVTVTVSPKVTAPPTIDQVNTCPFNTVDLAKGISSQVSTAGGVVEYYTSASLNSDTKVTNPATAGSGTYYVVEKTTNGCYSLPGIIHVNITTCNGQTPCTDLATANAGPDASICAAKTYQLAGIMGGAGKTAHWTTSGNGTFSSPYAVNAVYTASNEDVLAGKVTLTLSVSTNNAACPVAKDDLILTINGVKTAPKIQVTGSTSLCYGDSTTLQVQAQEGVVGYKWSNGATTQKIVVKTSGTYYVQAFDQSGCSSVKSDNVIVNVAAPVTTPLVTNLRNTCPSKIVDLTKALSTTNVGSSYIYRICECVTSNIVIRPDSVCEGTYWIVEKTAQGCVSAPARVVVKVFNCATDTLKTDVRITKTANTSIVRNGAPVTYTIKVDNLGSHTAKNIDVRDVLPQGLELVSTPAGSYTVSNGVITKRIDSLQAGQSYSMTYTARIVTKGSTIVNKAEITYLDQVDTNLANNTSSVSVTDSSAHRVSMIGLAKSVLGTPHMVGDSVLNVSYNFVVTNFGDDTLRKISIIDDLAFAFSPNTVVSSTVTMSGSTSTLKPDVSFTGGSSHANMLDSTSYLAPGRSQVMKLDVTIKRSAGDLTKSFNNIASTTAFNSVTTVSDMSANGGDADPDNDGNPTNNSGVTSFTLGVQQPSGPRIGVALAVVKVKLQADSSYNVTYKATIKNAGDVALTNVSMTDSLIRTFTAPVSYSVVGQPVVRSGSNLVINPAFNGNAQSNILTSASHLAAGEQDTVLITVNLKLNGNSGPFYSSILAEGRTADSSQVVRDVSNTGTDPAPEGAVSTTVRFDLPKGLLGVAKSAGTPTLVRTGIYDIPYTITLSNLGTVPLTKIQVVDKLSETFNHGALIVSNRVRIVAGTGLTVDTLYTGQGVVTNMLVDSLSTLAVGAKSSLSFTVRVDVKNADSLTFYNTARATALTPDKEVVEDMSTTGTNDDPDNDLDPRNNSQPTPVALNNLSSDSYIGLAMAVRDTVRKADGSFTITYQVVVKNYGPNALSAVSVTDSLSKVFNTQTGASFTITKAPVISSTGSTLKLNPAYNGASDPRLVLGDSTSTLAAGKVDTILVEVNVFTNGATTTFLNSAYAEAKAPTGTVTDVSTNGLNPDLNGNNNPTDQNEREATPLNLPPTNSTVFIPQGFSPNGDGVNDLFVVRGLEGTIISLEVYNRWGNMVYKNDDYHNDWDGKPNVGITINTDANGLPDGTYFYVINTNDGRKFVRYMTINR